MPGFVSYTWFLFMFVVKKKKSYEWGGDLMSSGDSEILNYHFNLHYFHKMLPLEETRQNVLGNLCISYNCM